MAACRPYGLLSHDISVHIYIYIYPASKREQQFIRFLRVGVDVSSRVDIHDIPQKPPSKKSSLPPGLPIAHIRSCLYTLGSKTVLPIHLELQGCEVLPLHSSLHLGLQEWTRNCVAYEKNVMLTQLPTASLCCSPGELHAHAHAHAHTHTHTHTHMLKHVLYGC